jgi:hypothetical protein
MAELVWSFVVKSAAVLAASRTAPVLDIDYILSALRYPPEPTAAEPDSSSGFRCHTPIVGERRDNPSSARRRPEDNFVSNFSEERRQRLSRYPELPRCFGEGSNRSER